jgi:hypothetical protein
MKDFDLKKYLAENKLIKEEEFKLYTTNVEYDNGEDGYMYQLVDAETGEENEIGFDQLYFDRDGNLLQLGIDFNDFEQTSYQDEEVSKEEALKMYSELLSENKLLKEEQMGSYTKFLKVIKSYEDEEILKDFLDSYPKGQDISKSEYDKFTEKHFGLADPENYRGKNWKYIMSENKLVKEEKRSVVDYDNRDDRTTELFLDNGDSVEVDVIELYDNLKENNPEDLAENKILKLKIKK